MDSYSNTLACITRQNVEWAALLFVRKENDLICKQAIRTDTADQLAEALHASTWVDRKTPILIGLAWSEVQLHDIEYSPNLPDSEVLFFAREKIQALTGEPGERFAIDFERISLINTEPCSHLMRVVAARKLLIDEWINFGNQYHLNISHIDVAEFGIPHLHNMHNALPGNQPHAFLIRQGTRLIHSICQSNHLISRTEMTLSALQCHDPSAFITAIKQHMLSVNTHTAVDTVGLIGFDNAQQSLIDGALPDNIVLKPMLYEWPSGHNEAINTVFWWCCYGLAIRNVSGD